MPDMKEPERGDAEHGRLIPELESLLRAVGPKLYPFRSAGIVRREQRKAKPRYAVT